MSDQPNESAKVKRFTQEFDSLCEYEGGEWVEWSSYEALLKERDELKAILVAIQNSLP